MKEIKDLEAQISEELDDAEKYINCALAKKELYPSLSALYLKLSIEEMWHAALLHTEVEKMIAEYRKEHGDPPERMLGRYDYARARNVSLENEINNFQQSQYILGQMGRWVGYAPSGTAAASGT